IIDHESYELQLKQSEAARDFAKAQLDLLTNGARKEDIKLVEEQFNQAKSNFDLAQKDKERFQSLYDSQSITKKQFDDASARFDIAQSQLNSAKENLTKIKNIARPEEIRQAKSNFEKAEASVALIQKSIADCFVTAPFNGTIVKTFAEKGEMLSMLSNLFKISDLSKVELVIYVSEKDLGKIKLGQTAEVSIDTYKDKTYEGKVIYISPEAEFTPKNIQTKDERTKLVFAVKIEIPNPNFELKAGMPADAVVRL
ncbi:MAG: HlyD family efflux transporter periplasmic adaptor subunit, partial [Melioribacteraceae bacterium]